MKKILFVIPTMRIGGAEKALVSLLQCLDPEQVSVDLFLFEHGGPLQKQIPSWVNILPEDIVTRAMTLELRYYWKDLIRQGKLGAAASRLSLRIMPRLRSLTNKEPLSSWDVIKKHIPSLKGEYDAAIGFLEGYTDYFVMEKVCAKKKIAWIHSDLGNQRLTKTDIERYDRFDNIATITEAAKTSFAMTASIPPERITVVKNIVSDEQILRLSDEFEPSWDESVPHILTVGRLELQKGSDIGLEACRILAKKGVKFCWHFIGMGSLKTILGNKAAEYGITDRCIFEGQKENPYPYMKRAELIVQPSRVEGKSIVLDEAKILGKAIVVTNYPSVTDQIENGVTGIVVKTDPVAIAEGIELLLNDYELRRKLELNSKETTSCSPQQVLKLFYAII